MNEQKIKLNESWPIIKPLFSPALICSFPLALLNTLGEVSKQGKAAQGSYHFTKIYKRLLIPCRKDSYTWQTKAIQLSFSFHSRGVHIFFFFFFSSD